VVKRFSPAKKLVNLIKRLIGMHHMNPTGEGDPTGA
jgi:hypothetical protein